MKSCYSGPKLELCFKIEDVIKAVDVQEENSERKTDMKNVNVSDAPSWYVTHSHTIALKECVVSDVADAHDAIVINKVLIDIAGDFNAGLLLTHILRISGWVKYYGFKFDSWICLSRIQWYAETYLTPKMFDRALKMLVEKNLVTKKRQFIESKSRITIKLNEDYLSSILQKRDTNLGYVSPCGYDPW